ncbi:helix-turn-helix transcriptional regulator [Cardiobacterium valvarum]|uniref:Predicted transcriptional regulator n=1 Tax=Cardiobacterium valvarum TaxID=194702 RepID=A0A381E5K8_9GAMM|nr:Predicted transcriptional regulator [Cardiobacterium valvarum]
MSAIHDKRDTVNRVKIYRQEKGLSQQALAQAVNVSRQTINLLENQDYNPTLALAIRIARALDSDLNTLFWEENHGRDTDEPTT